MKNKKEFVNPETTVSLTKNGWDYVKEDLHSGLGVKADKDKPMWSLMPWEQLSKVVDILTFGAKKYAPDNWKKVPDGKKRYEDALYRHMTSWSSGEKVDPESNETHLAHVICNALFLMWFEEQEAKKKKSLFKRLRNFRRKIYKNERSKRKN